MAPCFLRIFPGALFIEHLRGNQNLNVLLTAITVAVVGVVLNLAVFFKLHALFSRAAGPDWFGIGVVVAAFIGACRQSSAWRDPWFPLEDSLTAGEHQRPSCPVSRYPYQILSYPAK